MVAEREPPIRVAVPRDVALARDQEHRDPAEQLGAQRRVVLVADPNREIETTLDERNVAIGEVDARAGARGGGAGVTTPITSLSFADDEMMSERSIAVLHAAYANAPMTLRRYTPAALGEERIGHFGFFRNPALWPLLNL